MLAFTAILLTAFSALAGAPFEFALIGAAALFAASLNEHRKVAARFSGQRASGIFEIARWQCAAHALLAAGAAYGIGFVSRLALPL